MKTKVKYKISEQDKKIGNILKMSAAIVFFAVWIPAMVAVVNEIIKTFF